MIPKTVLTVVGARPQFIKAAVVSRIIRDRSDIKEVLVHTGQHYDRNMSAIFFDSLDIPKPDYNLGVIEANNAKMVGKMIIGLEKIITETKPDWILVYGDTNSTLAGAIVANKSGIKLAHVEAGLRSFNLNMPEEVNRILTDRLSEKLFIPTDNAAFNLKNEGYKEDKIILTGDVMYDASKYYAKFSADKSQLPEGLLNNEYVLCTVHRAENTNDKTRLSHIVEALNDINRMVRVIIPLHPRTKKYMDEYGLSLEATCIDPVGYFEMIELLKNCELVVTDSGGLQKEAYFFEKHCVTMRNETEWIELVDEGFNVLSGADHQKIVSCVKDSMNLKGDFTKRLYGEGNAGDKIVEALLDA